MKLRRIGSLPLLIVAGHALGQPGITTHSITGPADKEIRAGWFGSLGADCAPRPLPEIRVVDAAKNGEVKIRRAKVRTNSLPKCSNAEVPAQVVFYHARESYRGPDSFTLQVKDPGGEAALHKFNVSIAGMVQ